MATAKKRELYGLLWNPVTAPLEVEFQMIKAGGQVTRKDGSIAGNGLLWHWQRAKKLIWPDFETHRWDELRTKCFLEYTYIGEMGCAAGGKSQSACCNFLIDWYLWPSCTTTLVSSTDIPSLELRVWGMMKGYHKMAKEMYPWLPGFLIEGRRMITVDARTECEEGRDFRNGIIAVPVKKGSAWVGLGPLVGIHNKRVRLLADECFPAGTPVDTFSGSKPIEQVQPHELVLTAAGWNPVRRVFYKYASTLVRVRFQDGRTIDCTPNHHFLTQKGWKKACELNEGCFILSAYETMQILRGGNRIQRPHALLPEMQAPHQDLHCLRQGVQTPKEVPVEISGNLRTVLQREIDALSSSRGKNQTPFESAKEILETSPRFSKGNGQEASRLSLDRGAAVGSFCNNEGERPSPLSAWRKWAWADQSREAVALVVPGICLELRGKDREMEWQRVSLNLQSRSGFSALQTGNRGRWIYPQQPDPQGERLQEGSFLGGAWVDCVEVLKCGDPWSGPGRGVQENMVYNLEVEGHPSYSVNGLIVHNCNLMPRVFLDSTSNLSKAPDFKLQGLGNPNETTNAHGALCEPSTDIGGWDGGIDQTPGTKTWKTRWPNGVCIQTPGTDSPNMDFPADQPPRYPFLVTRQQIENDAAIWGRDDWHFTMMVDGKMPRGQGSRRVITRPLCERGRALEQPIWRDSRRTRIGFLDAAYKGVGGDRCVFGELQFGHEAEPLPEPGKPIFLLTSHDIEAPGQRQIIALIDLLVIPISGEKGSEEPEDQIVKFVMPQCENRGIPPENFFFDAGMRTSLVTAFARLWSAQVESLDSMGRPDERRVSANIDVKCCDYYSNRVTQFWYDMRHCVEAQQFRGLTEDAMREGCIREFKQVKGNKIEVETKADMKVKSGRSPDLFDAICYGLHGALRRGFVITKIGMLRERMDPTPQRWKTNAQEQSHQLWHENDLEFAD